MTPLVTEVAPSAADLYACDQYRFADLLTDVERTVLARLRAVLDVTVGPLLDEYWEKGEFPTQVMPDLIGLDLMEPAEITETGAVPSAIYAGFRNFELRTSRTCSRSSPVTVPTGRSRPSSSLVKRRESC